MKKSVQNALKLYYYGRREGVTGIARRVRDSIYHPQITYAVWRKKHRITRNMFMHQKSQSENWSLRIDVVCTFEGNRRHICESINKQSAAIAEICDIYEMGQGEYVLLVDSDVYFRPNAIYEFASEIIRDKNIDMIYSDHDINLQAGL